MLVALALTELLLPLVSRFLDADLNLHYFGSGGLILPILILPLMIAPVIAGVIWKLMFNPQFGILNHVLGLGNTFDWLSAGNALFSVILVSFRGWRSAALQPCPSARPG